MLTFRYSNNDIISVGLLIKIRWANYRYILDDPVNPIGVH